MMKQLYVLIFATWIVGCAKENSDEFFPYPTGVASDTTWTTETIASTQVHAIPAFISFAAHADSFDIATGGLLKFEGGTTVLIPPASCLLNGAPVNGKAKVELILLKTKGDFIRFARPTTSNNRLLESGGAYFIKLTKEGQELSLAPGAAYVIKYRFVSPKPNMKVFYGEQNATAPGNNNNFTWVPAQDTSRVSAFESRDSLGTTIRGYELLSQRFRWVNCDYFIDTTSARTRINAVLPPNFTNKNTTVFAVFKDRNIVVQLSAEFASRSFYAMNIPVGNNISFVALSKIDNDMYLAKSDHNVTQGLTVHLKPELKTKQQIIQLLESL